ncbi:YesK family protein [Paenibacillus riograndensis]|nr:YesK family protein [Paenibacillus riograndensis]
MMNAIISGIGVGMLLVLISWLLSRRGGQMKGFIFYPGLVGLIGGAILLVCSFSVIGGWEGMGYAFFSVPVIVISMLLLLFLGSFRRQT